MRFRFKKGGLLYKKGDFTEYETPVSQKRLEIFYEEIQFRRYVLLALEKIYHLYSCIATENLDILLLSKRINYSPELLSLLDFTKDFIKEMYTLSYPINDILIKCNDWKIAIQKIPSPNSDEPLIFIAFIPQDSLYYRRAIEWGIKIMQTLHH